MPKVDIIPPEILTEIVKVLRESYSPFKLDKTIGKLSEFIRMLILRPDRWPDFKFVSIRWGCGISRVSLSRDQHMEMLADVSFLKTAVDRLPDELYRLQNRPDGKIRGVETRQPCTTYVTDLAKAFKRLLDVGIAQTYPELLIFILTILNPYIQKLQIKINSSEVYDSDRRWRSQIFTVVGPLKFVSLEELHYVAVTSRKSNPRAVIYTRLSAQLLDIFMKIPTLKKLKVDGFAFKSESLSREVTKLGSCAVESLDLMYNFEVSFVKWRIFLSVFKKLKHFSYDGNSKDMFRNGRRIDDLVTPEFLGKLMQGIFVHRNSLESLSLTGIRRLISDHTHLKISTTPGFTQFSCLKHMKMQLDLLIGWEGESVGFRLHELLPKSLETLELWSHARLECMTLTENLSGLKTHKKTSPGFALREVKFGYATKRFKVEETWKNDMIKDLGENGIHLVFVGLLKKDVWWVHKPKN
ncbi:hypothetical protein BCON_0181g00160 [Botryotinia convoluta]|uniref:Uncharacterized protein n=1 Tax=Botryotinia convoluta TaxID=54673 RepID=A0A4Z1HN86_9HELO|nr:hypothetical protein BCON_0181g00160 [Botryotinia convoluta]